MDDVKKLVGTTINNYTLVKYINSGSFGNVFEGVHKKNGERVALKIPIKNDERDGLPSLLSEARIYKNIANPNNGIANMKIMKSKDTKIIVMDLLGPSLESLLTKHKRFGMKTIILLAMSMIDIMKHIHNCGYIHRDIKPDNFTVGYDNHSKLYCIDFGLSKKYIKKNGDHIPFSDKKRFCGTARYASINSHHRMELSRRDDLESLGYLIIYFLKGKLTDGL